MERVYFWSGSRRGPVGRRADDFIERRHTAAAFFPSRVRQMVKSGGGGGWKRAPKSKNEPQTRNHFAAELGHGIAHNKVFCGRAPNWQRRLPSTTRRRCRIAGTPVVLAFTTLGTNYAPAIAANSSSLDGRTIDTSAEGRG